MSNYSLTKLPSYLAESITALGKVDDELLRASILREIQSPAFRERYVIKSTHFQFNFFITKKNKKTFLFVFNRLEQEERILMKAAIQFDLKPVPFIDPENSDRLMSNNVLPDLYFWNVPYAGFLDNVKNKKLGTDAQSFFAYNEELKNWIAANNNEDEDSVSLSLSDTQINNGTNEVHQMIRLLLSCFHGLQNTKIRDQQQRFRNATALYRQGMLQYDIQNFQADVVLRLEEDGTLAMEEKQELFELKMNFNITHSQKHIITNMKMAPPDFLVQGDLYTAFLQCLMEEKMVVEQETFDDEDKQQADFLEAEMKERGRSPLAKIARKLDGYSESDVREVFLQSMDGGGSIYRIKKGRRFDMNMFVLSGIVRGQALRLVFSGRFKVNIDQVSGVVDVKLKNKISLRVLYNPVKGEIDKKAVKYFSRIFAYLGDWVSLLR